MSNLHSAYNAAFVFHLRRARIAVNIPDTWAPSDRCTMPPNLAPGIASNANCYRQTTHRTRKHAAHLGRDTTSLGPQSWQASLAASEMQAIVPMTAALSKAATALMEDDTPQNQAAVRCKAGSRTARRRLSALHGGNSILRIQHGHRSRRNNCGASCDAVCWLLTRTPQRHPGSHRRCAASGCSQNMQCYRLRSPFRRAGRRRQPTRWPHHDAATSFYAMRLSEQNPYTHTTPRPCADMQG